VEDHSCTAAAAGRDHSSTGGCMDVAELATVGSHTVDTGGGGGPAMAGSYRAQRWMAQEAQVLLPVGCSSKPTSGRVEGRSTMSFDWRDRRRTGVQRLGLLSSQSLAVEGDTGSH
jgi:hypothetical protein